ncbi:hypothetical protein BD289DRAFT_447557 [Coniella lustricola]|uniref:Uncharacterized protein n=1 Tax=Coniella lustricola TaxID=2025994 RepID=A0A2T2ZT09_9PEZI|nr:hypothetical protein BD289DRAFT_447557 [Coniella lustricola]
MRHRTNNNNKKCQPGRAERPISARRLIDLALNCSSTDLAAHSPSQTHFHCIQTDLFLNTHKHSHTYAHISTSLEVRSSNKARNYKHKVAPCSHIRVHITLSSRRLFRSIHSLAHPSPLPSSALPQTMVLAADVAASIYIRLESANQLSSRI